MKIAMKTTAIRKFLEVSTAHLPQELVDRDINTEGEIPGVIAERHEYGLWLWVPPDVDEWLADEWLAENADEPPPDSVVALLRYARACGCDYVRVDRDADTLADLPTFKWD